MEIHISVVGGDPAELESLDRWLRGERELAGRIWLAWPPPRQGELGIPAETIVAALGEGGAVTAVGAALAGALKAWLSQPHHSDIEVERTGSDGTMVKLAAKRVKAGDDLNAIIDQLFGPSGPQAPSPGAAGE